jgi:hypothetical protein
MGQNELRLASFILVLKNRKAGFSPNHHGSGNSGGGLIPRCWPSLAPLFFFSSKVQFSDQQFCTPCMGIIKNRSSK